MIMTLIILIAYVAIGFIAARISQSAIIERHRYHKGDRMRTNSVEYHRNPGYYHPTDGIYRRAVYVSTWMMIFTWPVYFFILATNARIDKSLNAADPVTQKRKIEEQERKIKESQRRVRELERELEIAP